MNVEVNEQRYSELIQKEAKHWGEKAPDPHNPQIWQDDKLFEIFFGKEYRHFIDRVVAHGPKVLELGCGEGNLAIELAKRGLAVDAIDLSPERIARARAKVQSNPQLHPPQFTIGDLNTISLNPRQYDCILVHDSLHHILNIDRLLGEASKALKPDGAIVVMDFIGMGSLRRLIAALFTAVLPTYQPYTEKLKLAKRLKAFVATEESKRKALASGKNNALHQDSPFEEISQRSIVMLLHRHFQIVEEFSSILSGTILLPRFDCHERFAIVLREHFVRWTTFSFLRILRMGRTYSWKAKKFEDRFQRGIEPASLHY